MREATLVVKEGKCSVCGKADEGVEIQEDFLVRVAVGGVNQLNYETKLSVFVCEGCWSEKFREFKKGV